VTEKAIINASPLIFLSRSHHLNLLQAFADNIWIPEPVASEILQRGQQDITARAIEKTAWLIVRPAPIITTIISEWRLGIGESSVVYWLWPHNILAPKRSLMIWPVESVLQV
jgi:predicted nucleic acid-binding protein